VADPTSFCNAAHAIEGIEEAVRSAILNVTFDCRDAAHQARFWSAVTRWPASKQEMPGNPFWLVASTGSDGVHLVFVEVPEPKTVKNRVHLDLVPEEGSQDDEVVRLEALGARIVDDRRMAEPGGWVMMADPEGNEFCVEPERATTT
jgi:predicted enzyme related to lactoylglutathione lyase